MTKSDWRLFEIAVKQFLETLDSALIVTHDYKEPDLHHGGLRQRDVWIQGPLFGLFEAAILVSCKRWKRKLTSKHIDDFSAEIASSRAQIGVIYSYSGFTEPALKKAKVLGVSCCRLFENEPPELPESLLFRAFYCIPNWHLNVDNFVAPDWPFTSIGGLFRYTFFHAGKNQVLLDFIEQQVQAALHGTIQRSQSSRELPKPYEIQIVIDNEDPDLSPLTLRVRGTFSCFQGKIEAFRASGTYEITHERFRGTFILPSFTPSVFDPGPEWTKLEENPGKVSRSLILIPILAPLDESELNELDSIAIPIVT